MRFIFIDEAGTAPKEPIRIVPGVTVETDRQMARIERAPKNVHDTFVPADFREGFAFHATEVFSGTDIDTRRWPLQDRLDLLKAVASLPYAFDAPLGPGRSEIGARETPRACPPDLARRIRA
ncbi:hypothetical protein [Phaeovulum vinaykumarii]|uniref:hypothetical protein n=1 Tax=Phaeovulum vinaykumarii TaxID=407234 RepID=UPI001179C864|nr:hypothetical protein [Phaeovulum vinaykumarii]